MFTKTILTNDGSVITSASSSTVFAESSPISLTEKWYDSHKMSLLIDLSGSTISASSTQLFTYFTVQDLSSGVSYTNVITGSGTTLMSYAGSGTSFGTRHGPAGNGVYNVPLTVVIAKGVTDFMPIVPSIKFHYRSQQATPQLSMKLVIS